jgi:Putative peptidoglycan binding domain
MHSRPGPHAERSGRTTSPGPILTNARVWIVGAIVLFLVSFLLSFAAVRWLPDLMTNSPDNASKPIAVTSISTSEPAPVEQSDNSQGVTTKRVIPIVIQRKTSLDAEVSDSPPRSEISSPLTTVVDMANTVSIPQLLDLREIENAKQVQQRLIDFGFLFGTADGIWGQRSRRALREFRAANGIGESDTWDEPTQERLLSAPDTKAANTSEISFIGGWGVDVAECRDSPITITARRAEGFGASCEFHSTQRETSNAWRLRAECSSNTERWTANIRLTVSTSKLTWSSERGTTTYVRCPMASASR